jgi:hypothetical protein
MIRRSTSCLGRDPAEPQPTEVKFIDKGVDHLHWIVLVDPVVQILWKERALFAIDAFNNALYAILRNSRITPQSESHTERFHTAKVKSGSKDPSRRCRLYSLSDCKSGHRDDDDESCQRHRLWLRIVKNRGIVNERVGAVIHAKNHSQRTRKAER